MAELPTKRAGTFARQAPITGLGRIAMNLQRRKLAADLLRAGIALLFVVVCAAISAATTAWAAGSDGTSGLPVPRFVSLKADRVAVRGGPDKDHDISWI